MKVYRVLVRQARLDEDPFGWSEAEIEVIAPNPPTARIRALTIARRRLQFLQHPTLPIEIVSTLEVQPIKHP